MQTQQERRDSQRVLCMREYRYEMMKPVDSGMVKLIEGLGYSINRSVGGMLLLLHEKMDQRQVFEIRVPSEEKKKQVTELGEVCWTRAIPVTARLNMYLVGIRFLLEIPFPGQ
ncbi:MAG TPA: hypothetical protein VIW47_04190 [Nitrospiraceae bacterium]|jgi:hypothetical protein